MKSEVSLEGEPGRGRLQGKVAIVVGAGSSGPGWGNGMAAAVLFAREGAGVVAVDRDAGALAEVKDHLTDIGVEHLVVEGDISNVESVDNIVAATLDAFGQVDVLHNNVGILRRGGTVDQEKADWDAVVAVNLTGTWLMCRAVIPAMIAAGGGSIINVASAAGIRYLGVPYVSYAATKAGILQMTQSTAVEFASRGVPEDVKQSETRLVTRSV